MQIIFGQRFPVGAPQQPTAVPRFGQNGDENGGDRFESLMKGAGFGDDLSGDDAFLAVMADAGLSPADQRDAALNSYLEHLQGILDGLETETPLWDAREPVGHQLQTSGRRLFEEALRDSDDLKQAVAELYLQCAEQVLDPAQTPADIANTVEEAFNELRGDVAVEAFSRELDNL